MSPETMVTLTGLFGWMTLLNMGIYLVSAGLILALRGWMTNLHARLFGLEAGQIGPTIYGWLGLYKLLIITLCLVPYLALRIVA